MEPGVRVSLHPLHERVFPVNEEIRTQAFGQKMKLAILFSCLVRNALGVLYKDYVLALWQDCSCWHQVYCSQLCTATSENDTYFERFYGGTWCFVPLSE